MSRLISKVSDSDLEHRAFPLCGTILGLIAALNVTSAAAMLLSL